MATFHLNPVNSVGREHSSMSAWLGMCERNGKGKGQGQREQHSKKIRGMQIQKKTVGIYFGAAQK